MFIPTAAFLLAQSIFADESPMISVSGADEVWDAEVGIIPAGAVDSGNANFLLPNEATVCHADEIWTVGIESVSNEAIDVNDASFILPNEAVICHADEVWTNDLASAKIGDVPQILSRTPILFVPGLLGTYIKDGGDFVWINDAMFNPVNSDEFMDSLSLSDVFLPINNNLSLAGVIGKKIYDLMGIIKFNYDYSDGLIKEFQAQGYDAAEGSSGQTFYTFPYDWRYGASGIYPVSAGTSQRPLTNSDLLKIEIDRLAKISPTGEVDVIAHSLGGLIAKKYILENSNLKINKMVFVGVPNLGAPLAGKALLSGTDFGVFGLNPQELKKIVQNMPAAYDLLPSQEYFSDKGNWVNIYKPSGVSGVNDVSRLDYTQTQIYLAGANLNGTAIDNATALHSSDFDGDYVYANFWAKGVDSYNIVGCRSATFGTVEDWQNTDGTHSNYDFGAPSNGDDTVPLESANRFLAVDSKTFYAPKVKHGRMPSFDGIKEKIVSIISGNDIPIAAGKIISKSELSDNPNQCRLYGATIKIESPLAIKVSDQFGNLIESVEGVGLKNEIPGASFETVGDRKFVYLPTADNEQYQIDLQGTGSGTFTLIKEEIEGDNAVSADVFADIPVTTDFSGSLEIEGNAQIIKTNGVRIDSVEIPVGAVGDAIMPQTTVLINGQTPKEFYNDHAAITLSATDFAQTGTDSAGVLSINYRLDGAATTTLGTTTTIAVVNEGKHTLSYRAKDKLGNDEEEKNISFVIDKTSPELKFGFSQTKKDLAFSAADNYSASNTIAIVDKNGSLIATDQAGNTVELSFKEKNRKQSLRAQLLGLSYNGQMVDLSGSQLALAWFYGYTPKLPLLLTGLQLLPPIPKTLPKPGPLSFLLQQAKLKDGSFIVALFGNNKTLLLEYKNKKLNLKTFSGLKLLDFATNKGKLEWSY